MTLLDEGRAGYLQGSSTPTFVQNSRGQFFVRAANRRQVAVFTPSGKIVSLIDPPEKSARAVTLLPTVRGGVLAWALPEGKAFEVTDALGLRPHAAPLPYLPDFFRDDGTAIVAQHIQTRELIGYPLHLMAADGRIIRSFGAETPEYRMDLRLLVERVAAPASDGTVWSMAPGRYVLERWQPLNGTRLSRTSISSAWFTESANYPKDNMTRPSPLIISLWERDGLIWVLLRDADARWQPSSELEREVTPGLQNAKFDWVLEVVDPNSGRILASRRFPTVLLGRPPQPLVASYAVTSAGDPRGLDVWKPEITRKGEIK